MPVPISVIMLVFFFFIKSLECKIAITIFWLWFHNCLTLSEKSKTFNSMIVTCPKFTRKINPRISLGIYRMSWQLKRETNETISFKLLGFNSSNYNWFITWFSWQKSTFYAWCSFHFLAFNFFNFLIKTSFPWECVFSSVNRHYEMYTYSEHIISWFTY